MAGGEWQGKGASERPANLLSYADVSPPWLSAALLRAAWHGVTAAVPAAHLQAASGLESVHEGAQAAHVHLAGTRHVQDGVDQVVVCLEGEERMPGEQKSSREPPHALNTARRYQTSRPHSQVPGAPVLVGPALARRTNKDSLSP